MNALELADDSWNGAWPTVFVLDGVLLYLDE